MSNSEPFPEGTVILAEEQYAGRGQQANVWHSEAGKNLTFSLLLQPVFLHPSRQFLLNKAISVAVNETLSEVVGSRFDIKWPNDIFFSGAKAGGILIENVLSGERWRHAIVGIGINVNQASFPSPLGNATSIAKILHSDYSLSSLLSQLCNRIEAWYLRLKAGHENEIERYYLSRLFRFGEQARYRLPDGSLILGVITGVSPQGQLEVLTAGETRRFDLKEIEFLS